MATNSNLLALSSMDESSVCAYSDDPFCLGMCDWTDCATMAKPRPSTEPLPSSSCSESLPLSANEPLPCQRFSFASEEQLADLAKGIVPLNTTKSTKWALKKGFEDWKQERNERFKSDPVPENILLSDDPTLLNTHLSQFAVEARKVNGEHYPPSTVYQLLSGLLRYMREANPNCPNYLNKQDTRFQPLQHTLDAHFHRLHSKGIGIQVKHTEIVTKEEELKLWTSGVMGVDTPKSLQNAAFYIVGKMFSLRGGVEHRSLKLSQISRMSNPDQYVYHENVSKNHNGSFKKIHVKKKVVPIYACPEVGERCPVKVLDKYISKLPPHASEHDLFYLRPLQVVPADPKAPWYAAVPVGRDTLQKKFHLMCVQAGIKGNKTNHSLRATGATELYESGVPEKLIQKRTGHRSLEALRVYERTNVQQHKAVSSILSAPVVFIFSTNGNTQWYF